MLMLLLTGCATTIPDLVELKTDRASLPLLWRADPYCLQHDPLPMVGGGEGHAMLASGCQTTKRDFVALGISGGGAKASTFGGEVLFYLDAIGLLGYTDLISAVSGGSLAAAFYALSCTPGQPDCTVALPKGRGRPEWSYRDSMATLESGFAPMIETAVANFLIPGKRTPVSPEEFERYYEKHYFHGTDTTGSGKPFRFGDLNPRRPWLILNSTLVSGGRRLAESSRGAHFLRRRTADEFFHFAFTDYYFDRLGVKLEEFPLALAVTASGAFPALVDNVKLSNLRLCRELYPQGSSTCPTDTGLLRLTDGGANDNQGLVEIYATVAELAGNEARSDLSGPTRSPKLEVFRPGDHALFLVINSSITEAAGFNAPADSFLLGAIDRSSAAVDVYSAVGFNLRKQLYEASLEKLQRRHRDQHYTAAEIGLVTLNHYETGGFEISTAAEAGVSDGETAGHGDRATRQAAIFARLRQPAIRRQLALSSTHPQCLFEQSKLAEAGITSLASLSEQNKPCIRHAARWATALRGEELCGAGNVLADPQGLHCTADKHLAGFSGEQLATFDAIKPCNLDENSDTDARAIRTSLEDDLTFRADLKRRTGLDPLNARAAPLSSVCNLDWAGGAAPAEEN
jgi:hypothetical protein